MKQCEFCLGTGKIDCFNEEGNEIKKICPECVGKGYVEK